mmetsp:Transcript_40239/g.110796  ORF Transcript_40239/g.110796 Transcript_40239/m.110796 type:complete len:545 (+) Transcript_40239:2-1636(+)
MAKGKVKGPKQKKENALRSKLERSTSGLTRIFAAGMVSFRAHSQKISTSEKRPRTPCSPPASQRSSQRRRSSATSSDSLSYLFNPADETARAKRKFERKARAVPKQEIDELYATYVALRSVPYTSAFAGDTLRAARWELPISSINEDKVLQVMGLSADERDQIEGIQRGRGAGLELTEERQISQAIVRLAASPPSALGHVQRRTSQRLLRAYPLGLRFSGKNMSPRPGWLGGFQSICLNFSNNDLAVALHFALFDGSEGFVLKPSEMRRPSATSDGSSTAATTNSSPGAGVLGSIRREDCHGVPSTSRAAGDSSQTSHASCWPPLREHLSCTTVKILGLHKLPKFGESRPRYDGERGQCHRYHPELSGVPSPPSTCDPSCPGVKVAIHPIGGICALSTTLQLPEKIETEVSLPLRDNGMNAVFDEEVHCLATEPFATFVRVAVLDQDREVAYATAVLGRLRKGYRVLLLRSPLGTRIELCYLFVRITFGSAANVWLSPMQFAQQSLPLRALHLEEVSQLKSEMGRRHLDEVTQLKSEMERRMWV